MRRLLPLILLLATLAPLPAAAQSIEDLIRWVYLSQNQPGPAETKGFHFLSSPAQRSQFFSSRMVAFLAANDLQRQANAIGCIDFAPDIPGSDFNAQEIAQTLTLATVQDAGRTNVVARFRNFGQQAQVTYHFIVEDGLMRIDDVSGSGWQLSAIACPTQRPGQANAPQPPAAAASTNSYCFKKPDAELNMQMRPDGSVRFVLGTSSSTGHFCHMEGIARPDAGGWMHLDTQMGAPCELRLLPTADSGIRVSDRDFQCKRFYCGMAAGLDGIVFTRSEQVHCQPNW